MVAPIDAVLEAGQTLFGTGVAPEGPPKLLEPPKPAEIRVGEGTALAKLTERATAPVVPEQFGNLLVAPELHQALSALQNAGFIENPDNVDGSIVCNLDLFRKGNFHWHEKLRGEMGPLAAQTKDHDGTVVPTLARVFADIKVISRDDFEFNQALKKAHENKMRLEEKPLEAKPLFYIPENIKDALPNIRSIKLVRKADYYMGFWEINNLNLPEFHPTKESIKKTNTSNVPMRDAAAVQEIYNKNRGNGRRTENGLMVKYKNGKYDKISYRFFRERNFNGKPSLQDKKGKYIYLYNRPNEYFTRQHCPYLIDRKLVNPDDFNIRFKKGPYPGQKIPNKITYASVPLMSTRYYLGQEIIRRDIGNENYRVFRISENLGGVSQVNPDDKSQTLMHIFELQPKEGSLFGPRKTGNTIYSDATKDTFNIYDKETFLSRNPGTEMLFENFENYRQMCVRISSEAGLNLTRMSLPDQIRFLNLYEKHSSDQRFWSLIKDHQFDGLKTFILTARSGMDINSVYEINKDPAAKLFFRETAQIYDTISEFEEKYRPKLTPEQQMKADEYTAIATGHVSSLLEVTSHVITGENSSFTLNDSVVALRLARDRIYKTYHTLYALHDQDEISRQILDLLEKSRLDPKASALALELFEKDLTNRIAASGTNAAAETVKQTIDFYHLNHELYESVSQTTGDEKLERQMYKKYSDQRKLDGRPMTGKKIDLGTGLTGRMSRFMHGENPKEQIIGIDLVKPEVPQKANLGYAQADITNIPLPDSSIDNATAFWSVYNDLNEAQRHQLLTELQRVGKPGMEVYIGTPHLEGAGNSWMEFARKWHKAHPKSEFGTIQATIAGRTKVFYIIPDEKITAEFELHGFRLVESTEWTTETGKPRKDYVFKLEEKLTAFNK